MSSLSRAFVRRLASTGNAFDALVVGAGPGGLTCAGNLLDQGCRRMAMVDPSFTAGRITERYTEVPSNTKVKMFDAWARGTPTFERILDTAEDCRAYQHLRSLDQEKGCRLGEAADVARLISDGLRHDPRVTAITGRVDEIRRSNGRWLVPQFDVTTERIALATGSHPRPSTIARQYGKVELSLEAVLKPSTLQLPKDSVVAVIGSSHSAILALKNLHEAGHEVVNFYRSPLLFAEYKDGWILYDNTGLKGEVADWARSLPTNVRRIQLSRETEPTTYKEELPKCTHVCAAIGYDANPLPRVVVEGEHVHPEFDALTGRFRVNGELLPGLFGAGIAYPERVTDPVGNVESAVGWFKFMKFVKRVSPDWYSKL
ncbi:hypothetical protein PYCC9005_002725 [Savitreella phatthalungensis]